MSPKIDGLLDVARQTYCEIVEDMERHVSKLSEVHGLSLRLAFNAQKGYHIQVECHKKLFLGVFSKLHLNFSLQLVKVFIWISMICLKDFFDLTN